MKIVVVGPGAIGCAVAASIGSKSPSVYLLGREYHKEHFTKKPAVFKTKETEISAKVIPITVEDLSKDNIKPDAVLITLKANFTIDFMKELENHIPHDTFIVSLQNGLIAQDIYDQTAFKNVIACVVGFNIFTESTGVAVQASAGDFVIGRVTEDPFGTEIGEVPEFILELLNLAAPTSISSNITSDVWMKLMINSTINPICAIGNLTLGELYLQPDALKLAMWTWKELVHVVDALKLKLNPFQGQLHANMLYTYDIISYGISRTVVYRMTGLHGEALVSMLQDLRANKSTEIDFLNGRVVEFGKKHNVEMPINELLIETVKKLERGEAKPSKGFLKKLYRDLVLA
jgi:2-dehydropantoate 2-reductase